MKRPYRMRSPLADRFWSKVDKNGPIVRSGLGKCWLWKGSLDSHGYGQINVAGRPVKAPRVSFFLQHGVWPEEACHVCDNPPCVRPDHVFNGTHSQNQADMASKGRTKNNVCKTESNFAARFQRSKTSCPNGHAYTEENTIRFNGQWRRCRTCVNARKRAWRKRTGKR